MFELIENALQRSSMTIVWMVPARGAPAMQSIESKIARCRRRRSATRRGRAECLLPSQQYELTHNVYTWLCEIRRPVEHTSLVLNRTHPCVNVVCKYIFSQRSFNVFFLVLIIPRVSAISTSTNRAKHMPYRGVPRGGARRAQFYGTHHSGTLLRAI